MIQLTQLVHKRLSTIERFTGNTYPAARGDIMGAAVKLVADLAVDETVTDRVDWRPLRQAAARAACEGMFGDSHPPLEFWATDLGQWVAAAIGYPRPDITPTIAAAVLRCSRQNVWKQTSNGTLPLTPELLAHLAAARIWRAAAVR